MPLLIKYLTRLEQWLEYLLPFFSLWLVNTKKAEMYLYFVKAYGISKYNKISLVRYVCNLKQAWSWGGGGGGGG